MSTQPFDLKTTPSARSNSACSCQYGTVRPWLLTTRWQG